MPCSQRMTDRIEAPFSPQQIEAINRFQRECRTLHNYTCMGTLEPRSSDAHRRAAEEHGMGDPGSLVARADGLHCPGCGYSQTWCLAIMADEAAWREIDADFFRALAGTSEVI